MIDSSYFDSKSLSSLCSWKECGDLLLQSELFCLAIHYNNWTNWNRCKFFGDESEAFTQKKNILWWIHSCTLQALWVQNLCISPSMLFYLTQPQLVHSRPLVLSLSRVSPKSLQFYLSVPKWQQPHHPTPNNCHRRWWCSNWCYSWWGCWGLCGHWNCHICV